MSGTQSINPAPKVWTSMQPGETRVKSASFANLLAAGDTKIANPKATLSRDDDQVMGSSDLQLIAGPTLDGTDTIVSVTLGNGQLAPIKYWVRITATGATSNLPYVRSVAISIEPTLG